MAHAAHPAFQASRAKGRAAPVTSTLGVKEKSMSHRKFQFVTIALCATPFALGRSWSLTGNDPLRRCDGPYANDDGKLALPFLRWLSARPPCARSPPCGNPVSGERKFEGQSGSRIFPTIPARCFLITNILIVDDEPSIADTLAYALRTESYAPSCVGLGQEALSALRTGEYALVILDIGLPDINGFDVCRELRRHSNVPVIFLTARTDEIDRVIGLELGADDFVSKPFSPREVVSRVRAILRRSRRSVHPPSTDRAMFAVDTDGARIAYFGVWLSLTRYEFGMLSVLLEKPGKVYSRARLMEMVWSDAAETMDRTVDAHIKTLRAKLRAVRPGVDPIGTHRGLGYSIRSEGQ